jgi:cytochrome oxidase Cu insertion factor (SCO1/SenC/PrrC family)
MTDEPKDPVRADVLTSGGELPTRATLSEAERAAVFSTGRAPIDRAAALRAGSVPVPRKFVLWAIVGFAVLGFGGVAAEHFIGNAGVESVISTPPATLAGTASGPPSARTVPVGPSVGAAPAAVIGLRHLGLLKAPTLGLMDQHGSPWALSRTRGKVVVLSFLNAECNDLCPVQAQEISQADHLLGTRAASVEFVVVNSDPLETSLVVTPPALTQTGLSGLGNVTFLTGSLPSLSRAWNAYGVTVAVSNTTRLVSHTNVMFFIDPRGRLALLATPFGNEDSIGVYSLDPGTIHTFAQGVAVAAAGLLPRRS